MKVKFPDDVRLLGEYLAKRLDALEARMNSSDLQLSSSTPVHDAYGLNLKRQPLVTEDDFRRFEDTIANNEPAMEMVVRMTEVIITISSLCMKSSVMP